MNNQAYSPNINLSVFNEYQEKGYVSIPKAYTRNHILRIINVLTENNVFDYKQLNPIYNLITALPIIAELIITDPLKNSIQCLLGSQAFVVRAMIIDKTKENNWILDWHQDRRIAVTKPIETQGFLNWSLQYGVHHVCAPEAVLKNFLIARISLDKLSKENGAIYIIPNSHNGGIYNQEEIVENVKENDAIIYQMEPGDLMLMSPLLIHNSPGSQSTDSRRVLSIEFSASPLPNGLSFLT